MKLKNAYKSCEDDSVNFVFDNMLEARFVQRVPEYFICYLSSHTGCNKSCRFCHLTQTNQTSMTDTSIAEYLEQARHVLDYYSKTERMSKTVNFNFMARGEVLANKVFLENADEILFGLDQMAKELDLESRFNISTIMPEEINSYDLSRIVSKDFNHMYYYSLYSVDESFRKRWLPKSIPVDKALNKFKEWQDYTGETLALHWTFIENENDSEESVLNILNAINKHGLKCKFNLVRYNPYSPKQGKESDINILERNFLLIHKNLMHPDSRMVPRVGFDVKASCGMFVND